MATTNHRLGMLENPMKSAILGIFAAWMHTHEMERKGIKSPRMVQRVPE
jgi:hypothetical protein